MDKVVEYHNNGGELDQLDLGDLISNKKDFEHVQNEVLELTGESLNDEPLTFEDSEEEKESRSNDSSSDPKDKGGPGGSMSNSNSGPNSESHQTPETNSSNFSIL